MSTNYKGIDYASGTSTNRDTATGIRYGVIHQNEVLQAWADSSEPDYGRPVENLECPLCTATVEHPEEWGETVECPECHEHFECGLPDFAEPLGFTYEAEGYAAQCGEDGDIFIVKSPYFTYAQFCSPCAPGACYLGNPLETPEPDNAPDGVGFHDIYADNRAYCFGHDWFEDGKAPYPVYSVETHELIQPTV